MLQGKALEGSFLPRLRFPWFLAAAILAVVLLVGLGLWQWTAQKHPDRATGSRVVLIADFDNRTGQAVFEPTVRHLMNVAFSQSPSFRVFPHENVATALEQMRRPPTTRLDSGRCAGSSACARASLWIGGEIVRSGPGFSLTASAVGCSERWGCRLQTISPGSSELIRAVERSRR